MAKLKLNFEKEEDEAVFKVLLRCIKESRNKCLGPSARVITNGVLDKHKLMSACYKSRHTHGGESFHTNIQYWFGDCGMNYDGFDGTMYVVRLINALGKAPTLYSSLKLKLDAYENQKCSFNHIPYNDPNSCLHELEQAVKKAGLTSIYTTEKLKAIISRVDGISNHIPF